MDLILRPPRVFRKHQQQSARECDAHWTRTFSVSALSQALICSSSWRLSNSGLTTGSDRIPEVQSTTSVIIKKQNAQPYSYHLCASISFTSGPVLVNILNFRCRVVASHHSSWNTCAAISPRFMILTSFVYSLISYGAFSSLLRESGRDLL